MHQDRHKSDKIHSIAAHVVHEEMGGSVGDETNENAFELHHRELLPSHLWGHSVWESVFEWYRNRGLVAE